MVITRQYLRWSPSAVFGVIASTNGGVEFINDSNLGPKERLLACGACESVIMWDVKTGQQIRLLRGDKSEVMSLTVSSETGLLASGHFDGTIRVYDYTRGELKVMLSGHKSAVTALCFDGEGLRIASGGKDTDIVVWDVTNESGLFRLKGHKGVVTKVQFMTNHNVLVSSSKDTYIKLWDTETQHCFKTLVGHRSEVWSFVLFAHDSRLISGASDSELKVWDIMFRDDDVDEYQRKLEAIKSKANDEEEEEDIGDESEILIVERVGTIMRKSSQRLANITVDKSDRILVCHSKESYIECFRLRTEEEIRNSIRNRMKKERKRHKQENPDTDFSSNEIIINKTLSDQIERLEIIKTSAKVKYCDLLMANNELKVVVLLMNNSVELYSCKPSLPANLFGAIQIPGHRSDVRTVAISSDNYSIMSASAESVKVWNRSSGKCVTTITDGVEYALCSLFVPGDRYCILGTKTGKLQIFDIGAAQLHTNIQASEEDQPIWSVCLYPNQKGLVSGSEDKLVKFWSFELLRDSVTETRKLTLDYERTLKMDEGVLCVKITPNSKFIAVSLLDSTVKIFFMDTLKFFLSLYGHKFPVLCMDISHDSTIIATGSSDKNVKLWGLDFGDCHKSMFAHDDNIMCLQFIPNTHYFFTASKDKTLKQWDADNYEKVLTLDGHQAEIWAMAISPNGKFAVTASHDKSLRVWDKSNEPLVLEEEQENEREIEFEKSMLNLEETIIPGETNKETSLASKKTVETVKGAERIIEALDVFDEQLASDADYEAQRKSAIDRHQQPPEKPLPNPLMNVYATQCPYRFVLEVLRRIKSNELEETLLTLPFNYSVRLLKVLTQLLDRKWEIELLCRCICFIIRVNFGQITSTSSLLPTLDRLRTIMNDCVSDIKDLVGVNLSALQYFQSALESREEIALFGDAIDRRNEKKKKRAKRRQLTAAPILSWT